jgi:hypothetical protein
MDSIHLSGWRVAFWISLLLSFLSAFLSSSARAQDVQPLIRDLQSPPSRRAALEKLVSMGPAAAPAVQALIGVLSDPDELNRDFAITTLKSIGGAAKPALPELRKLATSDRSEEIRALAADAVEVIASAPGEQLTPGAAPAREPAVVEHPAEKRPVQSWPPSTLERSTPEGAPITAVNFQTVEQTTTGVALIANQPGMKSAKEAIRNAVRSLAGTFDAKPQVIAAYKDQQDTRGGASFTAKLNGQAMRGVIIVGTSADAAVISVVYDRADSDPRSLSLLAAGLPTATPEPQFQQVNIPDGSGTVNIPTTWRMISGQRGMCTVRGPEGQEINLGIATSVVTPELAQYRRQMAANMGIPAQNMLVAAPDDPVKAWVDLLPQLSALCQEKGLPPFQLIKVNGAKQVENSHNWPSAFVDFVLDVGPQNQCVRSRAIAMVICAPVGGGQWMLHFSQMTAPIAIFDREFPTMMQTWAGWQVSDIEIDRRMKEAADSIKAAGDILRRAREERAAHEAQRARQQKEIDKNPDFDEALRGWRTVEDTLTGEKRTVDLGNVEIIVRELNEREGWPRYQDIPQRYEW